MAKRCCRKLATYYTLQKVEQNNKRKTAANNLNFFLQLSVYAREGKKRGAGRELPAYALQFTLDAFATHTHKHKHTQTHTNTTHVVVVTASEDNVAYAQCAFR